MVDSTSAKTSVSSAQTPKKSISRAKVHGWFILVNGLLALLVALRYFSYVPAAEGFWDSLYRAAATFSQMVLLAALVGLVLLPIALLPWERIRRFVLAGGASFGLSFLVVDTLVFDQYRFHINAVVLELFLSGEVISFPLSTYLTVGLGILLLFVAEYALLGWLAKGPRLVHLRLGRRFTALVVAALLVTHGSHIWAAAYSYQPITSFTRFLPLFHPATANSFMRKNGLIDAEALARQEAMKLKDSGTLQYPLEPLVTQPVEKPLNILWIVVDSWRADTFNEEDTPHMWQFAQRGAVLHNHLSAGNATRAGIFGLFYGIPSTYWHAFLDSRRSPLLMDRLQELDYQLGIFASAHLLKPEFHQTVFSRVPNLRVRSEGANAVERDLDITQDWLEWYESRDPNRPSFSFLFYDAPHSYLFPEGYPHQRQPMVASMNYLELDNDFDPQLVYNRYRTSVHYVDSLVKQVLERLEESGELENTLVLITGDHGEEMNDNKLNYWGHNSNFTNAQVHVPFALVGPGVEPIKAWNEANTVTSHEDVAPTFLKHVLGVENPLETYTTGKSLLDEPVQRPWVISSDYNGYALISEESILELSTMGSYRLLDRTNRPKQGEVNFAHVQQALEVLSRFYK